ncbi:MAG: hypothetical protein Q7S72_00145 [Candidatus Taylorbacteria bacterium]|nr:hypothetical protein [Candidatus Taylorbacteria bacterium]
MKRLSRNSKVSIGYILTLMAITALIGHTVVLANKPLISPIPNDFIVYNPDITPTPTYNPNPTKAEVVAEVARVFESEKPEVLKKALDISFCESKWNAKAYNFNSNHTGDHSVFQVNDVHTSRFGNTFKTNWKENIQVAHKIYKKQGWGPWVCNRSV